MTQLSYDAAHWPHPADCACTDCAADRAADASLAPDAAFVGRCMLAGLIAGILLVAMLDLLTGGPGLGVMVGR